MSKLPEIRISFGELLFDNEARLLAEKNKRELKSKEYYFERTREYWQAWDEVGAKLLDSLQSVLGVNFYKAIIDVTCVPFFIPKSSPVIMNFKETPDRFVDVLMHELCHVLLTDNNRYQEYIETPEHFLSQDWSELFGMDHSHTTLVHIPVHALCKYVWLDILQSPDRLERDIADCKSWVGGEEYIKSWQYVNVHDYRSIIESLRKVYQ